MAMSVTHSRRMMIVIGSITAVLLFALVPALVFARIFLVGFYVIPQNGMYPGLPAGSRLLTLKHPYTAPAQVRRGDVIVFVLDTERGSYTYIWRVVGLPGDAISAAGASLVINGQPVAREQVRQQDDTTIFREHAGDATYEIAISQSPPVTPADVSVVVPPDHFFVMGDNRLNAADSRSFGSIPFAAIIGRKL
jgi:signal peptidase I